MRSAKLKLVVSDTFEPPIMLPDAKLDWLAIEYQYDQADTRHGAEFPPFLAWLKARLK